MAFVRNTLRKSRQQIPHRPKQGSSIEENCREHKHAALSTRRHPTTPASFAARATLERMPKPNVPWKYIVDECFFAMGQAIGMRTTVDYDAVIFMRDHYRAKFLAAMNAFGNRWAQDRQNVTGVATDVWRARCSPCRRSKLHRPRVGEKGRRRRRAVLQAPLAPGRQIWGPLLRRGAVTHRRLLVHGRRRLGESARREAACDRRSCE